MDVPIRLPHLGAEDQPIRLAQWLVEDGEHVLESDRVAEILVGGMLFYVPSPAEGTVHRILEPEGTGLKPGQCLGHIRTNGAS